MCINLHINTTNGRITKRGSKVAGWILTQIAQAAARTKYSKLKEFFNRKKKSIGHAKAIIALARKIATIIWHMGLRLRE